MRPVNLIPLADRRGDNAPLRTGPLAYLALGALVLALAGVSLLVLANNDISDRKSELSQVRQEDAEAEARAESLAPYAQFAALHEQRLQTIASLADSRFDWERVMRELSLILPHDVWLSSLDASAGSEAGGSSGSASSGGGSLSGSITGPSLAISGCAAGHDAVAGFVTALKDIDGVTRVGVESSELGEAQEGAGSTSGSSSGEGGGDCQTRSFIAAFNLIVAFDAAPVPNLESEEAAPVSPTEKSEASASEVSGEDEEAGSEG
ncbi:MAG TPA: PilN domain-containing protein [Solirubrobacterales bacterium]|jgi:Tfp pilus assembly protein PilN